MRKGQGRGLGGWWVGQSPSEAGGRPPPPQPGLSGGSCHPRRCRRAGGRAAERGPTAAPPAPGAPRGVGRRGGHFGNLIHSGGTSPLPACPSRTPFDTWRAAMGSGPPRGVVPGPGGPPSPRDTPLGPPSGPSPTCMRWGPPCKDVVWGPLRHSRLKNSSHFPQEDYPRPVFLIGWSTYLPVWRNSAALMQSQQNW